MILEDAFKPIEITHYDQLVCAKPSNKTLFPELHEIIRECNIHGPCHALNASTTCMINGKCSHHYPHTFSQCTMVANDGYHVYMRRVGGKKVHVKFSPRLVQLSICINAHIKVMIEQPSRFT